MHTRSLVPNPEPRSLIWERDKWTREIGGWPERTAAVLSLPVVVAKAYAVYTTLVNCLHIATRSFSKAI